MLSAYDRRTGRRTPPAPPLPPPSPRVDPPGKDSEKGPPVEKRGFITTGPR